MKTMHASGTFASFADFKLKFLDFFFNSFFLVSVFNDPVVCVLLEGNRQFSFFFFV